MQGDYREINERSKNLFSWYPFKAGSSILLICDNTSSLIDYFRQVSEDVTVYGIDEKGLERIDRQFDYIIVYGGLEYAKHMMADQESPYLAFLKQLKRLIAPTETAAVFIATDNRIGLKYFAGAPESYTQNYFLGIRDYEDTDEIRTFTKGELKDMLSKVFLGPFGFLYPYPDYRYPSEIFDSVTVNTMGYGRPYKNMLSRRFELFNETKAAKVLSDEQIMGTLANSFLIQIDYSDEIYEYIKYSDDRKDRFRIYTAIIKEKGKRKVVKAAYAPAAIDHIGQILDNADAFSYEDMRMLPAKRIDEKSIEYEYLYGDNLNAIIKASLQDADKIREIIDEFYNRLKGHSSLQGYSCADFEEVFGTATLAEDKAMCMKPANIDLIFDNIYPKDGMYEIIDGEWIFDLAVPTGFILWRSINEIYDKILSLNQVIDKNELLKSYDISAEDVRIFESWNRYFTEEYVGANSITGDEADSDLLSLNDIRITTDKGPKIAAHLNYDKLSERVVKYVDIEAKRGNIYKADYDTFEPDKISNISFYPAVPRFYDSRILKTEGIESITPIGASKDEQGFDCFGARNGGYSITLKENARHITIEYELVFTEQKKLDEYAELYNRLESKTNELEGIYNSRSWKLITKLGRVVKWRRRKD